MQVEAACLPSCLRPHGPVEQPWGPAWTGLAWRALGEPLSCPRERWACALSLPASPPLGPRRQPSTPRCPQGGGSARSFLCLPLVKETRDAAQTEQQRGKPAARWGRPAARGAHCRSPSAHLGGPFAASSPASVDRAQDPRGAGLVTACFRPAPRELGSGRGR